MASSCLGTQFFDTPPEAFKDKNLKQCDYDWKMDTERTANYIFGLEDLLMLNELMKSDGVMTVSFVEDFLEEYIKQFMERWSATLGRSIGAGWKITKFHSLMHFCEMLLQVGNGKVFDTETGENIHVVHKVLAQRAQRHSNTFD